MRLVLEDVRDPNAESRRLREEGLDGGPAVVNVIKMFFRLELNKLERWSIWQALSALARDKPGNTKGESINVPLTSCLTGLE